MWLGLCVVLVPPSPKFQDHAVGVPEDVSVKVTVSGAVPLVGFAVKLATGLEELADRERENIVPYPCPSLFTYAPPLEVMP